MQVEIKCPYCGYVNKKESSVFTNAETVYCDVDNGGCDAQFIAQVSVTVTHTVKTAKLPELEVQPS